MFKKVFNFKSIFRKNVLLFFIIVALFFLNFYSKTLFFRPSSIHQWRQTDCLSITKNYYEEGMHFFEPKIHFQGPKDGKAVSEFPILNYTVAALWKVFGEHEIIYRLLEYFLFIVAVFVVFNSLLRHYKSGLMAIFTVSILLTSPLLTYYSVNFIADVPAFSLGIMSFCLFMRFYYSKSIGFFYGALILGVLAVLIKASALVGLSVLLFFSIIDLLNLNRFFGTEKLFKNKTLNILLMGISISLIIAWYRFAISYNDNNSNNIFLLTVLPIWEMDEEQLFFNLKMLFNHLFPLFLNKAMLFLFVVMVVYVITKFKRLNVFLKFSFLFSGLYFVFYLLFFFQVFSVHDYYLNNLMIFPVITFVCTTHIILETNFIPNNKLFLRSIVALIFVFNAFHASAIYRLRSIKDDKLNVWYPFVSEDEMKLANYLFWDYGNSIKKIENLKPSLRAHAIKREDFVLSIPDQSFDISLYFMDQKGYTISRDHLINDTTVADRFLTRNVKYLVLSDTNLKNQIAFKRISSHIEPLYSRNGVQVFKFKNWH